MRPLVAALRRKTLPDHGRRASVTAFLAVVACLGWAIEPAASQEVGALERPTRVAVFLDCGFCDQTFIRQEMTYVDYVRDREAAHVHVLMTRQNTGAGGRAHTFDLIGRGAFRGTDYSTVNTARAGATDAEVRDGILRTLQAALVPYLLQTPLGARLTVGVEPIDGSETGPMEPRDDPWNQWTIEIYADGSADFEARQESFNTRYGAYVSRVTEDWKIQLRPFFNYNYDRFERDEGTITSTSRRDGFTSYVVRSISPHWSVGAFGDVFTSTYDNVDIRYRLMPAVEYSVYPYREATRRQLTFAYRVGASHVAYRDTTIYDETEQFLPEQTLSAGYEVTQPWGRVDIGGNASQYLHDLERYSLWTGGRIEVRVTQGLSVQVGGEAALIHNQVNLPKGDADLEEILLRRRQLETNYRGRLNLGLRYRFGSIYNNVVNTRFGGGGGQDRF
jgi:predicted metal-binding protein